MVIWPSPYLETGHVFYPTFHARLCRVVILYGNMNCLLSKLTVFAWYNFGALLENPTIKWQKTPHVYVMMTSPNLHTSGIILVLDLVNKYDNWTEWWWRLLFWCLNLWILFNCFGRFAFVRNIFRDILTYMFVYKFYSNSNNAVINNNNNNNRLIIFRTHIME